MSEQSENGETQGVTILSAEYVAEADLGDGCLDVGGVEVRMTPRSGGVGVFVRRRSDDLSVIEVHVATHDGYAMEQCAAQRTEAQRYPLWAKQYWPNKLRLTDVPAKNMTEKDLEFFWAAYFSAVCDEHSGEHRNAGSEEGREDLGDVTVLPAEYMGEADIVDGYLDVGDVTVHMNSRHCGIGVYVRRRADDLSVLEVHAATHDGYAQEELDAQNAEADRYPLGPKEYWRSKMVGDIDGNGIVFTDEDFEEFWEE